MPEKSNHPFVPIKPGIISLVALYLFLAAQIARTITRVENLDLLPWFWVLYIVYVVLFTVVIWKPGIPSAILITYFAIQSIITLMMLSLEPEIDFVTALFVPLSYQAALVFGNSKRWIWVGIFLVLTVGSLIFYMGMLEGLAFGLIPMAGCIILPAFVYVNQEIESTKDRSQTMLAELLKTQQELQAKTEQVENLAVIEERNRLARQLHDLVSQTIFSISLNSRAAQMMLEKDPERVRSQLMRLQDMAQNALAEMRDLIAQLRL